VLGLLTFVGVGLLTALPAHAQTFTWASSPANWYWNATALDWNTGGKSNVAWVNSTTSSQAVFNTTAGSTTLAVNSAISANAITFNSGAAGYALGASGGTITLGTGGITAHETATIQTPITLFGGTESWTVDSTKTLTVGAVSDGGSAYGLVKTGNGTLALTGNSTYTGGTTVSGGTLVVAGSLGNTAVTVSPGAALGGTGTIGGSVTVSAGAGPLAGGSLNLIDGTVGTLTLSDSNSADTVLTVGRGPIGSPSMLAFEVGTTADRIQATAGKVMVDPGGAVINITTLPGFGPGDYDLIDFMSGQASGLGNLTLATTSLSGYTLSLQTTPTAEQLVVKGTPEPGTLALLAAAVACGLVAWRRKAEGP
jgi:autotransporter-associated beta strand protein